MKQVYAPANAAEAHMLAHMLHQNGITAHIHGEALQGGVGELPAAGLLQLLVVDEDYDRARALIAAWERTNVPSPDGKTETPRPPIVMGLVVLAMGLGGGWLLKSLGAQNGIPIDAQQWGVDQNADGVDDVVNFIRVGASYAYKTEIDRNFDGAVDETFNFDANGLTTSRVSDDDFDGFFETRTSYRDGNAAITATDADRDGATDRNLFYVHGVASREEVLDDETERVIAANYWDEPWLTRSESDLDGDGFLETLRTYDARGEITSTETRQRP